MVSSSLKTYLVLLAVCFVSGCQHPSMASEENSAGTAACAGDDVSSNKSKGSIIRTCLDPGLQLGPN